MSKLSELLTCQFNAARGAKPLDFGETLVDVLRVGMFLDAHVRDVDAFEAVLADNASFPPDE